MKHISQAYNDRIQDSAGIIPIDEPVILLRGQDIIAIKAARYYALECRKAGLEEQAELISNHVLEMANWQDGHKRKLPDSPTQLNIQYHEEK